MPDLLEAAVNYASEHKDILPLVPSGKAPATSSGYLDATSDTASVTRWWLSNARYNIGYALPEDIFVVDVDPRNGGEIPPNLPKTLTCLTGGGGYHYYYHYRGNNPLRKTIAPGVDIKTKGGYVLLPPSITTGTYTWEDPTVPIAEAPDWLIETVEKPQLQVTNVTPYYDDPTDMRPGSVYNRTATWHDVLSPAGWTIVDANPDGELFWCRPGKRYGISATTNYAGSDLLYVFSSSTNFEPDKGYSKFSAFTELYYGGDYTAAAAALALFSEPATNVTFKPVSDLKPNVYEFIPAFGEDHFVTKYIDYVHKQTDAPLEYAEASALVLLGIAGYQCKSALAPYPGGLANNLYVALVGPTTRSRKSTVQRITTDIVKAVTPHSILPNRATTEALIAALANRNGVPSIWAPDEFGITLAEIYNRDFMRGLEEMLLTVYSGDPYEYKRVLDSVIISSPNLSVLAAATPESIARAGTTALESGLLPRFGVVYPTTLPDSIPVGVTSDLKFERQYFISRLNSIITWSNNHSDITFSPEALTVLNDYESRILVQSAARLPTMLYKVAALSAISETRNVVTVDDAESAARVIQRWVDGISALVPVMYKHGSDQQFDQQLTYVIDQLKSNGGSAYRVQIANLISVKKQRLDELESTLQDRGIIHIETGVNGKNWILNNENNKS